MNLRDRILQDAQNYVRPTLYIVYQMKNKYGATKKQREICKRWQALVARERKRRSHKKSQTETWWQVMFGEQGPKWSDVISAPKWGF